MGRLGKMVLQLEDGTEINLGNILKEGVGNKITDSDVMVPVDAQSRYQKTIQTQSAINVLPSAWNQSGWIDCTGYENIAVTFMNDATASSNGNILWSNDGVNQHGEENAVFPAGTGIRKAGGTTVKAKWAKIALNNADTVAHVMSAWVYLRV